MNLQAKIFTGQDPAEIQEQLNAWFETHKISKVDVEQVLQSTMPDGRIWITVIYEHYDRNNRPR